MVGKTVRYYIAMRSCSEFAIFFHAATYVMYLMECGGLNLLEVNLVNLGFFVTLMIFEIPTGAVADIFGRRMAYVCACCLMALSFLVYAQSRTFWWFVFGEVIAAIGSTLANGAIQAWMVDRIRHFDNDVAPSRVFAAEQYCCGFTRMIGGVLGAYCYTIDPGLSWLVGGIVMLFVAFGALFSMKEEYRKEKRSVLRVNVTSFQKTIEALKHHALNNKAVRFLVIMSFVNMLVVSAPNMQWQPFFLSLNSNKVFLGYIVAFNFVAMMLGTFTATKFVLPFLGKKRAILVGQLVVGLGISATTFFGFHTALLLFLAHEVGRGAWYPLRDIYLHDNIPSDHRATLASFTSTSNHVGGIVGLLLSGFVAQSVSIPVAWSVSGFLMILTVAILWRDGGSF